MKRYWVIAPYDSRNPEVWNKVWDFDLLNNVIAIGWKGLKDISNLSGDDLKDLIEKIFPDKKQGWKTWSFNSMWNFWHEIKLDDIIIARKGTKRIAGIGKVIKTAFYDEKMGYQRVEEKTENYYSNFVGVEWQKDKRDIQFDKPIFSFQTIYEITETKFNTLFTGNEIDIEMEGEEILSKTEFIMEKYLEDFIVSNFDTIFNKELKLYIDEEKNIGQQYPTDIGIIDILAQDSKDNSFVIIELKKGRPADKVVGQTLRYMGWVSENLATENQKVKGLIICKDADPKLMFALKMTQNIGLKFYSIDFKLVDTV